MEEGAPEKTISDFTGGEPVGWIPRWRGCLGEVSVHDLAHTTRRLFQGTAVRTRALSAEGNLPMYRRGARPGSQPTRSLRQLKKLRPCMFPPRKHSAKIQQARRRGQRFRTASWRLQSRIRPVGSSPLKSCLSSPRPRGHPELPDPWPKAPGQPPRHTNARIHRRGLEAKPPTPTRPTDNASEGH